MLYRFLFFIGVKDELIRLIKALYSGFLSSSESKKPVCKCSYFTLPGIILSGIGKQTANAKCIKHKKTEELYEQIGRSYARHNL